MQISDAMKYVKLALAGNSGHSPSWNLLVLLLSSQKQYLEALKVCNFAMKECLDLKYYHSFSKNIHVQLIYRLYKTKIKLEQVMGHLDQALVTLKEAFAKYKILEPHSEKEMR